MEDPQPLPVQSTANGGATPVEVGARPSAKRSFWSRIALRRDPAPSEKSAGPGSSNDTIASRLSAIEEKLGGVEASIDLASTPAAITIYGNNENERSSSIGDRMAVGDVNGDGSSDFFFGYYHAQVEGWDSPGHSGVFWGILGSPTLDASYDVGADEFH